MKQPNSAFLHESETTQSLSLAKKLGFLGITAALAGVSIAIYAARRAAQGAKTGTEQVIDAVVSIVEHDYEDSAEPLQIDRITKSAE